MNRGHGRSAQRAVALRLALLVAIVMLWARSCRTTDRVSVNIGVASAQVYTFRHGVYFLTADRPYFHTGYSQDDNPWNRRPLLGNIVDFWDSIKLHSPSAGAQSQLHSVLGFGYSPPELQAPGEADECRFFTFWIPLWLPLVIIATMLGRAVAFARRLRARRTQGLCVACGYDLRATVTACCPECGAPIQNAARARSPAQ
jgi:hypothetical protein